MRLLRENRVDRPARRLIAAAVFVLWTPAVCCAEASSILPTRAEERNAILAVVEGKPITVEDVLPMTRAREYQAAAALSGPALAEAVRKLRAEAVESMIDRRLIVADYEAGTFRLTANDIEHEVDAAAERAGCRSRRDLIRRLRETGSDLAKFRREIEEQMIVQLMLQRAYAIRNFITPAEVRRRYDAEPEKYCRPERLRLAMLRIAPTRADRAELQQEMEKAFAAEPERFAEFARRYSDAPGREAGGDLGWIELGKLRTEFAAALKGKELRSGMIAGPLTTPEGVVYLRVLEHEAAFVEPFESVAPKLREEMEEELRAESRREYCERLRRNAFVTYYVEERPGNGGTAAVAGEAKKDSQIQKLKP